MTMAVQGDNLVVVPQMKLERLLSMKGGKGETSYVKNSQAQARHARSMLHLLEEALDLMHLPLVDSPFAVADLGCSCGGNTLFIVDVIVKHVTKRYETLGIVSPEFQAFFSDLPSNDFNVLFQLLPPLVDKRSLEGCLSADGRRSYYAAGVPGSFYRRLFAGRSIDFFHSAFSLHWLSQVPDSVTDRRSPAYNNGGIFIHGASRHTAEAYKKQFQADLANFLWCRSLEMKRGGSMFLVCLGRTSTDPTDQGGAGLLFGSHFEEAWNDLVQEGLIDEEKRDSFNIPVYAPSLGEFEEVVEADGSFTINKLEVVSGGSPLVVTRPDDPAEVGRALANSCWAVCGVLVEAHIGDQMGHEVFARLERRAAGHARELMEKLQFFHIVASLSLE
ncbi:Indole-3-acetate O-methyltransferase 1 [Acorus calamus]|uniref:Indole-3-acetate O-methyltransferase 1 n=1 Tax=Acorus calamus TaxID=4465 RepID=A0AAV9E077_ACOCL|nr:Indole-3-acetate O-methyltransferase 1 [Acorus calamus]